MSDAIYLMTDGPHSPEYTVKVANAVAEAIRCLNYATMAGAVGLEYPADAYALLGALYTATERMPQLFRQMAAFMDGWQASGQLGDSSGRDPTVQETAAAGHLGHAGFLAGQLTEALQSAQNAISGLYVTAGDGTEGESGGPPAQAD